MKVVITSLGQDLESALDGRFGRARWFIVADSDSGEYEAVDNSENLQAAHGAGVQAAQKVVSLGAQAVISGNFGPHAIEILQAAKIKTYRADGGTVGDALAALKNNQLEEVNEAGTAGHAG